MAKPLAKGDYVLATKYADGDPGDQFVIGFYDAPMTMYDPPRHNIVDKDGKPFRGNGFRRVAKISHDRGVWLVNHIDQISQGCRSVWWWKRASMQQADNGSTSRE